ncbi:hypothetical protein T02_1340 [Trichinella nativa]|uniref:Uncharacterized protein n=1 Tax=Trichinella nativa TaxID=6335 RepID=A0A0V1L0K9_9BILA|nr:hypothetical protein T02_1340 [Trichinella nativa]
MTSTPNGTERSNVYSNAACNSAWPIVKSAQPDRPGYVDQ